MADEGDSVNQYDVESDFLSINRELDVFLDGISEEMTEEDVNRAKYFCSGEEGIPLEVLNSITSGIDLFQLLRRRNYLDRNNLLYLQAILWNLGKERRALYHRLSEFAKRCELEPLEFFTNEEQSIPGLSYVNFRVLGTDISRQDISRIRALVSELVMVPLHLVHINSVTKSDPNILIIFRFPQEVVEAFKKLTREEKGLLQNECIDLVCIETEEIRTATPSLETSDGDLPLDYEFNLTLLKIGQKLTDQDLEKMKFLCSGEDGLGRRVQENIKTPLQFFDQLKRSKHLDRHNLLYLQSLLWNIKRKDLYQRFVDFARQCIRTPLHFYSNDAEEDDSNRTAVRFHISGVTIDRRQIQKLQGLVSKLLQIPEETIFLNGVRPFHSIVVTFLIPNSAVAILKDLTSEEKGLLQQCDVDCVFIGELKISLKGKKFEIPEKLKEMDEIEKLLNRNKKLQKELDDVQAQQMKEQEERQILLNVRKTLMKIQSDLRRPFKGYFEKHSRTLLGKQEDTSSKYLWMIKDLPTESIFITDLDLEAPIMYHSKEESVEYNTPLSFY